ncbi:hypothetical protein GJ496_007260 [Pomphorhynchus laevis]|nr:hypothetical protein GJ496_007260 [Pomphorhynchus laevis]
MSDSEDEIELQNTTENISNECKTFQELGLCETLSHACKALNWNTPTSIQQVAIPAALNGNDIIGLAETGSGKSGAFALPILQDLLQCKKSLFALVLTPTRELAFQISEHFTALGSSMGVNVVVIVGGVDMVTQSIALAKRPHIVIATPGRLADHIQHTKGFNLKSIKYLVLDEADRILNMDFGKEVDLVLRNCPSDRRTFLFSATMTQKVSKLERASLVNPIRLQVTNKYQTVDSLKQFYLFIPAKFKDSYLVYILNEHIGKSIIIFTGTCQNTLRLALLLRNLSFTAIPLNGKLNQSKRLHCLNEFKAKSSSILIATDVASRGLDITHVDIVINYDVPANGKDYIHRVGRTARAGRNGTAITMITQYDIESYQRVETALKQKLPVYDIDKSAVMKFNESVQESQNLANSKLKGIEAKKRRNKSNAANSSDEEDSSRSLGIRRNLLLITMQPINISFLTSKVDLSVWQAVCKLSSLIDFPPDYWIPEQKLSTDKIYNVVVSSFKDIYNFWIQLIDDTSNKEFIKMMENMNIELMHQTGQSDNLKLNHIYAVNHPVDKCWYRAELLARPSANEYICRLIDFGELIKVNQIYMLQRKFLSVPRQAIQCCLDRVLIRSDKLTNMHNIQIRRHLLGSSNVSIMVKNKLRQCYCVDMYIKNNNYAKFVLEPSELVTFVDDQQFVKQFILMKSDLDAGLSDLHYSESLAKYLQPSDEYIHLFEMFANPIITEDSHSAIEPCCDDVVMEEIRERLDDIIVDNDGSYFMIITEILQFRPPMFYGHMFPDRDKYELLISNMIQEATMIYQSSNDISDCLVNISKMQMFVTIDNDSDEIVRVALKKVDDHIMVKSLDYGHSWIWNERSRLIPIVSDILPMAKLFTLCGVPEDTENLYSKFVEFASSSSILHAILINDKSKSSDYLITSALTEKPLPILLINPFTQLNHYQAILNLNNPENHPVTENCCEISTDLVEEIQQAVPKYVSGKEIKSDAVPVLANYCDFDGDLPPINTWTIAQIMHFVDGTNIIYVSFPFGFQSESSIKDASSAMLLHHIKNGYSLRQLSLYMSSSLKHEIMPPVDATYEIGECVLVYFPSSKNNKWVRGKIIECTNCDSICKVHLYDFGIEQFTHISQLYRIPDNLVEVLPSQAIKVVINRKSALPSLSDTIRSLLKRQFVFLKLVSHENIVEIACQINHPCRKMLYLSEL